MDLSKNVFTVIKELWNLSINKTKHKTQGRQFKQPLGIIKKNYCFENFEKFPGIEVFPLPQNELPH